MGRTLAANYSLQLLDLLSSRPGIVDAVKVSELHDPSYVRTYRELAATKTLVMHGVAQNFSGARKPSPGDRAFAGSLDIELLRVALDICQPSYISVHLELHAVRHLDPGVFLEHLISDVGLLRPPTFPGRCGSQPPVHLRSGIRARSPEIHRNQPSPRYRPRGGCRVAPRRTDL